MKRTDVLAFLVSFSAALTVGATHPAYARRAPAANCLYQTDFIGDYELPLGGLLQNNSGGVGGRDRLAFCPIVDDGSFSSNNWTTVFVDVNDGNSSTEVKAQLCMTGFAASSVVHCGTSVGTGAAFFGDATLTPPLPAVQPVGYAWVTVVLPQSRSGFLHGTEWL